MYAEEETHVQELGTTSIAPAFGDDYSDIVSKAKVNNFVTTLAREGQHMSDDLKETMGGAKKEIADTCLDSVVEFLATANIDIARIPYIDFKTQRIRDLKKQADRVESEIMEGGDHSMLNELERLKARNTIDITYVQKKKP